MRLCSDHFFMNYIRKVIFLNKLILYCVIYVSPVTQHMHTLLFSVLLWGFFGFSTRLSLKKGQRASSAIVFHINPVIHSVRSIIDHFRIHLFWLELRCSGKFMIHIFKIWISFSLEGVFVLNQHIFTAT